MAPPGGSQDGVFLFLPKTFKKTTPQKITIFGPQPPPPPEAQIQTLLAGLRSMFLDHFHQVTFRCFWRGEIVDIRSVNATSSREVRA